MRPSSSELWQKAYDTLDPKHKAIVPSDFATKPEKLIVEVEKYISQSQGKPIRLPNGDNLFVRDVLQKLSRWIKKFVEVGDAAVQYDPGHAALPWALLRLLLQASMNNIEKHAAVLEGIEKVAYYLVWGRIEEAFLAMSFEAHTKLELDFIQLYAGALTFVTRSIRFLHSKPQRIATAFFTSDSKFQKDMAQMAARKQSIESHVQQIMDQSSLKQWNEVKSQLADLHQPLIRVEQMLQSTSAIMGRAETERILDWASEIPFEGHFRTVQKKALDGTGKWLFRDPDFVAWETCSRSQILWLHGGAGCGKSTLASMLVQSLIRAHEEQQGPYPIYFFCSRNTAEPERADPEQILRSLMRQVSDLPGGPPLHSILKGRYERRRVKGSVTTEEVVEILMSTIEVRPATYIIIDALDECDRQKRDTLVDALKTVLTTSDSLIKIFVTSRDSHYDIASSMDGYPALCIDASRNQDDINYYVRHSVRRAIDKRKILRTEHVTDDLQQAIVDSLCNGADGMFRWVELQLELLYNIRVRSILLERLKRLPPRLEEIYNELYDYKMQELGEEQAKVVRTILSWLLVAKVPLHTSEILQLICTSEEAEMSVETVLDITFDFVRLDTEQDQLKFSHLSVREFLEKKEAEFGQVVLQTMATCTCLEILAGVKNIDAGSYAALYWPFHAKDATREGGGAMPIRQLDTFLTKHNTYFKTWNDTMFRELVLTGGRYQPPLKRRLRQALAKTCNPLLVAACFDLPTTLQRIISETDQLARINLRNCKGESALQLASQYGSVESARALLERGADANVRGGKYGNALCAASSEGYMDIVKLLLNNGADVNAIWLTWKSETSWGTIAALYAAASKGHADIAELLLRSGANVTTEVTGLGLITRGRPVSTALYAASSEGHEGIVKLLLLTKEADVNAQGGRHGNSLCAASFRGHLGIVELLLNSGASVDVNTRSNHSSSVLCAASARGHIEVAKLLLRKGADINAPDGRYGNALCAALHGESLELVILLLDKGADVKARRGAGGYALHLASRKGYLEIVRLLLERGADVKASGIALYDASAAGHTEIVKLLLREGASINARKGRYQFNALCAAISQGFHELVNLLLEKGADVNNQGALGTNPLCAAISQGSLELVNLLLDKGADVNAQEGNYRNALCTASSTESLEIMSLLLDKGADVNARGCNLGNALQAASSTGQVEIVKLLVDRDADVNAVGGFYGNALQAASYEGHIDIVRLLLESGANVNAWGTIPGRYELFHMKLGKQAYRFHATPQYVSDKVTSSVVYAAACKGHKEIVELLLDNNADVNPGEDALCVACETSTSSLDTSPDVASTDTALHVASSRGSTEIVKILLSKGVDVNIPGGFQTRHSYQNRDGSDFTTQESRDDNRPPPASSTALQAASLGGHEEVVKMLLDAGANVNAQAGGHSDALQAASANGHVEIAKLLLDHGATTSTALQAASAGGHRNVVKLFLDKSASINTQGELCNDALQAACASGTERSDVVEMLLHTRADANDQGHLPNLPLQLASARGHEKVVKLLLDAGADVNAPRHEKHSDYAEGGDCQPNALCAASYKGHWEVVKILLDAGAADDSPEGQEHGRALVAASSRGHTEIVRLLLDIGADVNSQEGNSLQAALFGNHYEVAKLLLDRGANIYTQGGWYGSPLQAACASQELRPEVVKLLLDAGADVNAQGQVYGSALQAACSSSREQLEKVKILLHAGADINAQGGQYGNALQAAYNKGHTEVIKLLLTAGAQYLEQQVDIDQVEPQRRYRPMSCP